MSSPHTPTMSVRQIWRRFWPHARPQWPLLAWTLLLVLLGPILEAAAIWLFKVVVDEVMTPRDLGAFAWIAPIYLGIAVVGGIASGLDTLLSARVAERFVLSLRSNVFAHLQTLSLEVFERRRLGDTLSRLSGDINSIESLMLSGAADGVSYALRILLFGGLLFFIRWDLALVALAVAPLFWFASRYFSRRIKSASRAQRAAAGALISSAEESLANTQLIQAYNGEAAALSRFNIEAEKGYDAAMDSARVRARFSPIVDGLEVVGAILVIGLGTWELSKGRISLGGLLAFLTYLRGLYGPIRGVANLMNIAAAASAGAERVVELLDERPAVETPPNSRPMKRLAGSIELRDVSFHYPQRDKPALDGVSLTLSPGRIVAIVGSSGAGKSTIAKLLLRFYEPTGGTILVDGRDITEITPAEMRANVATVLQETLVLDGTVRANIAFGAPDASDEDITAAARLADAHDFIMALPDGYETEVGQRGRRLSGGQRQRIAIARAMIRDAQLLILDEPTTGIDGDSTERILEPLRRLMEGRTTLIISHSLSTVRDVDEIVVLDGGRVVERGGHDELLRANGTYARLCALQGIQVTPAQLATVGVERRRGIGAGLMDRMQVAIATASSGRRGTNIWRPRQRERR